LPFLCAPPAEKSTAQKYPNFTFKNDFKRYLTKVMKQFLQKILDLRATVDFEKAKSTVSEGFSLRGYNL